MSAIVERCKQILRYGGMGHTMSIHSPNEQIVLEFVLKKPAFRISVNTPSTFGSIGLTTGLPPAMMLGCGGYGGNITSDNILWRHGFLGQPGECNHAAGVSANVRRTTAGARKPSRSISHCWL